MAVFEWRRRPTTHFGEVSVPFAHIEILDSRNHFQAFAVQVDSGATVSLFRKSVAQVLGVHCEAGRQIDLTGVGGATTRAYVHDMTARFGREGSPFGVPFAIADAENVPNLPGRLRVFDNFQVDFDPSLEETRITGPWLDQDDRKMWTFLMEVEQHILSRWRDIEFPESGRESARRFLQRASQVVGAAAGLVKLHREFAGPVLIRALFEFSAQFEYLLRDPESRGRRYLDYEHVSRYQMQEAFLVAPTGVVSRYLAESPLRNKAEERARCEFERVKAQLEDSRGKVARNWYGMSFRNLVREISSSELDRDAEYTRWYALYSGWLHGDPFSSRFDTQVTAKSLLLQCFCYYSRMLLRIADKMILTAEQHEGLRELAKQLS